MNLKGFTLIEVLLVMMIISILLLGSISLTVKYSADLQWNRVFNRLEQMLLDVNTYALAGISMGYKDGEVVELPGMYHLFIKKGEPIVWYLESRALAAGEMGDGDRKIVYQEKRNLDVLSMELEDIFLREDGGGGVEDHSESVLVTWSSPFARLSFYDQADVEFAGDELKETFDLGESSERCEENCLLFLEYQRSGGQMHVISFDLQKGIYRDFY